MDTHLERKRLFIFDFDGTLCDDFEVSLAILNELAPKFRFRKVEEDKVELFRTKTTLEVMKELGISRFKLPWIAAAARRSLRRKLPELSPIPQIPEALRELAKRGTQLGILTSNSKANVTSFLKQSPWPDFQFIHSETNLFGKAHVLKKLIRHLKYPPSQVFYVGDEGRDVRAAREAGVRSVAVTWGFQARAGLLAQQPEALLDRPEELLELI